MSRPPHTHGSVQNWGALKWWCPFRLALHLAEKGRTQKHTLIYSCGLPLKCEPIPGIWHVVRPSCPGFCRANGGCHDACGGYLGGYLRAGVFVFALCVHALWRFFLLTRATIEAWAPCSIGWPGAQRSSTFFWGGAQKGLTRTPRSHSPQMPCFRLVNRSSRIAQVRFEDAQVSLTWWFGALDLDLNPFPPLTTKG